MYIYIYLSIQLYTDIHMYTCVFIYIYIHTHIPSSPAYCQGLIFLSLSSSHYDYADEYEYTSVKMYMQDVQTHVDRCVHFTRMG